MSDLEKSNNQLLSEIFESKRIENYLRAEVSELWEYIRKVQALPFFDTWLKIATKVNVKKSQKTNRYEKSFPGGDSTNVSPQIINCDFLFVYSSDVHEIGGLKTAGKLARDLFKLESWNIKGFALSHDPTIAKDDGLFVYKVLPESKIKNVVACGSDTIDAAMKIAKEFNAKLVLLMMGLDQIFAPNWQESKNFIKAMQIADLVICLAPHLAKQAKLYGAKNIAVATLGFDERDFFYSGSEKKKKIIIPCRISPEKGLKVLLPVIPLLRNKGWEVVGFGDLQEHSAAEVFDRFLGRVGPNDLMQEFQDARFLIDPSWIEGLGLVALEASACGVVPIITARADYVDLFTDSIKPFFELPNFIDPEKLLAIIENHRNWPDPSQVCLSVSSLMWGKGLTQASSALRSLF